MNKFKSGFYVLMFTFVFISCDPPIDPKPETGQNEANVTIKLKPYFGLQDLSWSTYYITAAGDTIQFDKIKFLLSDFTFEKTTGELVVMKDVYAYINIKEGRDSIIIPKVPKGLYQSVRFSIGIDSAVNHSNPAGRLPDDPLSPALNEMHWGWAGGYIFNVIEGYYKNKGATAGFSFHIASDKNLRTHSFVASYEIKADTKIFFDLQADKYFSNVINFSLKTDGAFSHSGTTDPVMDKFIQNTNGIFVFNRVE